MVKRLGLKAITPLLMISACADPSISIAEAHTVKVAGHSSLEGGEFCSDFRLDDAAADRALREARILSVQDYTGSEHLPCVVYGSAEIEARPVRWELDAGGLGVVRWPDGKTTYFQCIRCRADFGRDRGG